MCTGFLTTLPQSAIFLFIALHLKFFSTELRYDNKSETEIFFEPIITEDNLEASLVYVSKQKFLQIKWNIKDEENV